jgi:hypothetical protein
MCEKELSEDSQTHLPGQSPMERQRTPTKKRKKNPESLDSK